MTGAGGARRHRAARHGRRPHRHHAAPWIVTHRWLALGAASVAVLAVLAAVSATLGSGGRPVDTTASAGGESSSAPTPAPTPPPTPAVPSAGELSVAGPTTSPTAGTPQPRSEAGGQDGRGRGPKRTAAPQPKPTGWHPPGRPRPLADATAAVPNSAAAPAQPERTGS